MKCPTCIETNLVMSERQGVEIDYCPNCRGVWLDRGELDKIIERSESRPAQPQQAYSQQQGYHKDDRYRYQKRKSFLSELFD